MQNIPQSISDDMSKQTQYRIILSDPDNLGLREITAGNEREIYTYILKRTNLLN